MKNSRFANYIEGYSNNDDLYLQTYRAFLK